MDIGIYTTRDVLEHKKKDGMYRLDAYCFWTFKKMPKGLTLDSRFWFACDGKWQGWFEVQGFTTELESRDGEIRFHSEYWHELKDKPERKPFQGFTYKVPRVE